MSNTSATDCGTHWCGGPDFAIEIVSPGDHTLDKLDFYAKVGTRELLVIDRNPWQLTLYRLIDGRLAPVSISSPQQPAEFASAVIPLHLQFDAAVACIRLMHTDGSAIRNIPIQTF